MNDYRKMAENGKEVGQCTNCNRLIYFSEIAKEIREGSYEEVICQDCWNLD